MRKRSCVIILFAILSVVTAHGQNVTSRLKIMRGARLDFFFNSYSKFLNGVTYESYTELQIVYTDTTNTGVQNPAGGWQLTLRALQNSMSGDMTTESLDLGTIKCRVRFQGTEYGPFDLSAAETVLLSESITQPTTNETVQISYDCGTTAANSLLNKKDDVYFIDLEFTLKPQ